MKPMHSCKGFVRDIVPSNMILLLVHEAEDLVLKSLKVIVNKALLVVASLKIFSKFDRRRSIYNTNITFIVLNKYFTNNAFTKI